MDFIILLAKKQDITVGCIGEEIVTMHEFVFLKTSVSHSLCGFVVGVHTPYCHGYKATIWIPATEHIDDAIACIDQERVVQLYLLIPE